MKLRTKTLAIICTVSCILAVALGVTLDYIVTGGYSAIEKQNVTMNVGRVQNQLHQEEMNLASVAYDWSVWDDTYSFVNGTNQEYIQENLQYGIFNQININFMFFYNNSGDLVYAKVFDFNRGIEIHLPYYLFSYIRDNKNSLLSRPSLDYNLSGILYYSENETPLLMSVAPILHNDGSGPIGGTLIIGKFFDDDKIASLENITQLFIVLHPISDPVEEASLQAPSYVDGKTVYIQPVNSTYIAGYYTENDILGHPAFILEVGSNRYVYNQGLGLIQNLMISLLVIIIVFVVLILFIVDRFVTSPLTHLTNSINDIQASRDLSKKFHAKGNDEIALLENKIDTMLSSLHKAWTSKEVTELSLKKKVDELERFKKITVDREIRMMELKKQLDDLRADVGGKADDH